MSLDFALAVDAMNREAFEARLREEREEAARRLDDRLDRLAKSEREAKPDAIELLQLAILTGATKGEIEKLAGRLNAHQAAVIEALQENREELDQAEEDLGRMLEEAHVLLDGRRVFRTKDGRQVFDEHGALVAPEELDPRDVDPSRPSWEDYRSGRDRQEALRAEQRDLLEYQCRLDEAEERLQRGEPSREELDELDDLLHTSAPEAVRERLPESEPAHLASDAEVNPETYLAYGTPETAADLSDPAFDAILGPTSPGTGTPR
ncbi:MAG: hypothetical protein AAGG47_17900 [Pseudomonadota bacterium]